MTDLRKNNGKNQTEKARKSSWLSTLVALLFMAALAYFGKTYFLDKAAHMPEAPRMQPQAPAVVLHPVRKADLSVGREYVGRVEPIRTVSLKPQISGEIEKVSFREGSLVKAGQLLFTLDDRQYRATVALRKAELAKAEANYDRAVKYDKRLKAADKRSVSASDIELSESDVLQSRALVQQARAMLRLAEIDLGYTRIEAPITGLAGKAALTKGNYVTPATGELTTIVQTDPIRITFALPDRDYLDQLAAFKSSKDSVYDATIRLANGTVYPISGTRDFEDNTMDPRTGTMTVSLRFDNPEGALVPGSMVRVTARPAHSHIATIIPQAAVLTDAEGDFVYTVDGDDTVHVARITLGAEIGTNYEVTSGLEEGEQIILYGIQSVRPGVKVRPMSQTKGKTAKTPAERAAESVYDLKPLSSGDKTGATTEPAGESD